MSYVEANLVPGERVIDKTKLHWSVMLWNIIFGCLCLLLGGFLLYYARTHVEIGVNSLYITEIAAIVLYRGRLRPHSSCRQPEAKRNGNGGDEPTRDHKKRSGKPNNDRNAA